MSMDKTIFDRLFPMGTIWRPRDVDLVSVYRMIFRRLQREGCDWHYRSNHLKTDDPSQDVSASRRRPLPATVEAYHIVYGHYAQGWPV